MVAEHDVEAVPFYCTGCNSDVKLWLADNESGDSVSIGCECNLMEIIDFDPHAVPDNWEAKRPA